MMSSRCWVQLDDVFSLYRRDEVGGDGLEDAVVLLVAGVLDLVRLFHDVADLFCRAEVLDDFYEQVGFFHGQL